MGQDNSIIETQSPENHKVERLSIIEAMSEVQNYFASEQQLLEKIAHERFTTKMRWEMFLSGLTNGKHWLKESILSYLLGALFLALVPTIMYVNFDEKWSSLYGTITYIVVWSPLLGYQIYFLLQAKKFILGNISYLMFRWIMLGRQIYLTIIIFILLYFQQHTVKWMLTHASTVEWFTDIIFTIWSWMSHKPIEFFGNKYNFLIYFYEYILPRIQEDCHFFLLAYLIGLAIPIGLVITRAVKLKLRQFQETRFKEY